MKIIFLYGSNYGLVDLLYNNSIRLLDIKITDPFNVSKIDGKEFKENPFILHNFVMFAMFFKHFSGCFGWVDGLG